MKNRLLKGLALAATLSFAAGVTIVPAQAASEILIWADETRGPNLTKVFAKKGDWVPGSTIKVVSFSSYDALKDALDKASGTTGPDIFVAGNDWVPALAKSGKLAPVVLTAAQKAQFTPSQFFDSAIKNPRIWGLPANATPKMVMNAIMNELNGSTLTDNFPNLDDQLKPLPKD